MRGTIKRVGKIFRDGHGVLQTEGWDIEPGGDFTLQDLVYIASTYPQGAGPYTFGLALDKGEVRRKKKAKRKHPFSIKKRRR